MCRCGISADRLTRSLAGSGFGSGASGAEAERAGALFGAPAHYQPSYAAYHVAVPFWSDTRSSPAATAQDRPRPAPAWPVPAAATRMLELTHMDAAAVGTHTRRPRFRRAAEPPPFRLTDHDVEIVRVVARYRLIRSTHIAVLVGRSLDRTNDRLMRL